MVILDEGARARAVKKLLSRCDTRLAISRLFAWGDLVILRRLGRLRQMRERHVTDLGTVADGFFRQVTDSRFQLREFAPGACVLQTMKKVDRGDLEIRIDIQCALITSDRFAVPPRFCQ